jgi:hypothetical protein
MMERYPLERDTEERPIPVFPLVGSMITDPGRSFPSRSAASIMAKAIRSLTDPVGLKASTLARSRRDNPWAFSIPFRRSKGVPPINSAALFAIFMISFLSFFFHLQFRVFLGYFGAFSDRFGEKNVRTDHSVGSDDRFASEN